MKLYYMSYSYITLNNIYLRLFYCAEAELTKDIDKSNPTFLLNTERFRIQINIFFRIN